MPSGPNAPFAVPEWDAYIASMLGPPDPYANDPEPEQYGGPGDAPTFQPAIPATQEDILALEKHRLDEAFAKGTGPYPEGVRTDKARIEQATGPVGTIGQIGKTSDPGQRQAEAPAGWEGLSPDEAAQIEIGQSELLTPPGLVPFAADATSGADQRPPDDAAVSTAPLPTEKPVETYGTPEQIGEAWAGLSPEEQLARRRSVEQPKEDLRLSGTIEANRKASEAFAAAEQERQRRMAAVAQRHAQLDIEAKKLADENPLDRISGGRKILGVLAAIFGGFAANKTGRNMGLEVVGQIADEAAQQQAQRIALNRQQMGALGDERQAAEDEFRQANLVRLAVYDGAIKKLETDVQALDPKGSQALALMGEINQLKAMRLAQWVRDGEADIKREQQKFENDIKLGELGVKVGNLQLAQQKAAGAGGAKPVKLEDVPRSLDELRKMGIAIPEDVTLPPDAPGLSINQAKKLAETGKSGEDWAKAARENSPEERNRQFAVGELTDVDGKPLQFRSTEGAGKVAALKGSADFAVQLLDRLDQQYQRYGWSSDLLQSPEWQEAQADLNQYMLEKKNVDQLGVLAGPDLDLIKGSMGKTDVTGIRNPGPGLHRARINIIEKLNSTVRAEAADGSKPRRWEPPKPPKPPALTTAEKAADKITQWSPKTVVPMPKEMADLIANTKDVDEQFAIIEAEAALSGDRGDRARELLRNIATRAVSPAASIRAEKILETLPGANQRTDEAR